MDQKTIISMWISTIFMFGCGSKEKTNQELEKKTANSEYSVQSTDKLVERAHYQSLNGIDIWCIYNGSTSADFSTSALLSQDEIKAFVADRMIMPEKTLLFRYKDLDLPPYAIVAEGHINYDEKISPEAIEAKERERQMKEAKRQEQVEEERQAKIKETEEEFRYDKKNFTDYLSTVTVGTTMKDFNQAIYKLSDSGNEYKIIYRYYGNRADELKELLTAKQKQVFPLIRERYVTYYREAFKALGRGDIKFIQSGTTLNLLSDEFNIASVRASVYESMGTDMANYRFKKLILKTSDGQVIKQYNIKSKNDTDL